MNNTWLLERRDLYVKDTVKEFIRAHSFFGNLYHTFLSTRKISFEDLEVWVGSETIKGGLWRLKDKCHHLWRQPDPDADINATLLDWVIGSIFHEAMKLKENIYMVQYYGPQVERMNGNQVPETNRRFWQECQQFIKKTDNDVMSQMEGLGFLFGRGSYILRAMMPGQAHNALLVRFLVENAEAVEHLWGERLEDLLGEMFPRGAEYAYCAAAGSYLAGHWQEEALAAYGKALAVNGGCEEARRQTLVLKAIVSR